MRCHTSLRVLLILLAVTVHDPAVAAESAPDLTRQSPLDRELTYNLGATGLRGWIYSKPATHFDGLQGRTTDASRQILVTHVGVGSPADGVVQVGDVIVGTEGREFAGDARKELARELECPADLMGDSAQMNMWLHKTVLKKIADNGGNVPKELLD